MPIYEYQCTACGEHCEILQKVNDAPATQCPHCNTNELKRLVSAAGFQLKGSGWYVTDFRDKGKPTEKPEKKEDTPVKETTKAETPTKTEKTGDEGK